jgi:redox-regulated HSP33 family molecular chaperone
MNKFMRFYNVHLTIKPFHGDVALSALISAQLYQQKHLLLQRQLIHNILQNHPEIQAIVRQSIHFNCSCNIRHVMRSLLTI